jgi:type I restriction enzyme S subunit
MGMIDRYEFDFADPVIFVTTVGARAMTTRLVSGKFSLSQNCALIIPRTKELDTRYFEGVLRCLFNYERRSISLIMQPSLRFEDLDRFRVPLPPEDEQHAVAAVLDHGTAKIDTFVTKIQRGIEKLHEYRQSLISAAVTGKIDVRGHAASAASLEVPA